MDKQPLAYRLRPQTLKDIIGQQHLVGDNGFLVKMCASGQLVSLIFYGPPGTGKTTLALCLANDAKYPVRFFNAVTGNKKDLVAIFEETRISSSPLVIIIDEVHRLNKDKQDLLLPYLENGSLILFGCTTSNPFFAINPAIRSRCHCLEVKALTHEEIVEALYRACAHKDGFDGKYTLEQHAANRLADLSSGDIRYALNCLQAAVFYCDDSFIINDEVIDKCQFISNSSVFKDDDGHYDVESGLQKSIRGSDVDAALYYLAKLIQAEDMDSIERRLSVIAYEDIGLANPSACSRTVNALQAARMVGFPEARIILSVAVIDLALSPKSRSGENAIDNALALVNSKSVPMPDYLRLTPVGLTPDEKYDYELSQAWPYIQYLPDSIKNFKFYEPQANSSYEKQLLANYNQLTKIQRTSDLVSLKKKFKK